MKHCIVILSFILLSACSDSVSTGRVKRGGACDTAGAIARDHMNDPVICAENGQ